jgi:AraC-like DNA-binding protein
MISRTQNSHTVPQSVGWSWRHPATDIKQDAATTELQQENSLRWPIDLATEPGILVSRWTDSRSFYRCEHIETPSHFHIISVAMRAVVVKLSGPEGILYDGTMPSGMVHVTGPLQSLTAEFQSACDFIHIFVSNERFYHGQRAETIAQSSSAQPLSNILLRDRMVEQLCGMLTEPVNECDVECVESIGRTILMRVLGLGLIKPRARPLPKWRLRRVCDYIEAHIDETVSLADLAAVSGLSRMHFAAQFRVATGFRPHEYLLSRRVERAKSLLLGVDMPLAEVALSVGFQAQAHFSTVFKRLTGDSPAQWRRANMVSPQARSAA